MDTPQNMKLGHVKDLPAGDMKVVKAGDWEILLKNLDNAIYALSNYCTHGGCRLGYGKLIGETIRCPCYGLVFNVKTGEVLRDLQQSRNLLIK